MKLYLHRLAGEISEPRLLITAGIHGDEFEPMAVVRKLAAILAETPLRGSVTLIPIANEAAFRRGDRVAEDGLDLARAFPGRSDGTLTQRVAAALNEEISRTDYYIDLHTGGTRLKLAPMAGYFLHPTPQVLEMQRKMARAFNLPIVWGTTPTLQGRSLSAARDANVSTIYAEYGGGGFNSECVQAYVEGCLNVMALLGMIDRMPPAANVRIIVEDPRPDSGHLQINYPAEFDGYFEPLAAIGQDVAVGDLLGMLYDPTGSATVPITARQTGTLLMLRTFASVRQGEGLAVILENHPREQTK